MHVAKLKTLIRCVLSAQLICTFVFAYAKKNRFSHYMAQMSVACILNYLGQNLTKGILGRPALVKIMKINQNLKDELSSLNFNKNVCFNL